MDGTCSFTIKSHIFSIRLCYNHLESQLNKHSDWHYVVKDASGSKTLVSSVEQGEELAVMHDLSNLFPLSHSRVYSCWIVGAGMEKNHGTLWCSFEWGYHSVEVETFRLRFIISVFLPLKARVFYNGVMVSPAWLRNLNFTWDVGSNELKCNSQSSCSRNRLSCDNSSGFIGLGVSED